MNTGTLKTIQACKNSSDRELLYAMAAQNQALQDGFNPKSPAFYAAAARYEQEIRASLENVA